MPAKVREAGFAIADGRAISAGIRAALYVIHLVEVGEVEEVTSLRAHISNLHRNLLGHLRLKVQVVGNVARRNQLLRHRESAARAVTAENRRAVCGNGGDSRSRKTDGVESGPCLSQ